MSIRELAESDLGITLEDPSAFGWSLTLTDPAGFSNPEPIYGQSGDIAQVIDPDTGEAVMGRLAHVSVRLSTVRGIFGGKIPVGTNDETKTPWLVQFNDINGKAYKFKVTDSPPDRTLGYINLILGSWKENGN